MFPVIGAIGTIGSHVQAGVVARSSRGSGDRRSLRPGVAEFDADGLVELLGWIVAGVAAPVSDHPGALLQGGRRSGTSLSVTTSAGGLSLQTRTNPGCTIQGSLPSSSRWWLPPERV